MQNRMFALAIVLVGCGGSGGGGGTHFSTTVSGSTPVSSLTPSQQAEICSDTQSFLTSVDADLCKLSGFLAAAELSAADSAATSADLQAACSASYSDCLHGDAGAASAQCDFNSAQSASCTATVAQFSACLNDLGASIDQLVAKIPSCSSLTAQNIVSTEQQDAGTSAQPASCTAFNNACPGQMLTGSVGTKM